MRIAFRLPGGVLVSFFVGRNIVVTGVTEKGYQRLWQFSESDRMAAHAALDALKAKGDHGDALVDRIRSLPCE